MCCSDVFDVRLDSVRIPLHFRLDNCRVHRGTLHRHLSTSRPARSCYDRQTDRQTLPDAIPVHQHVLAMGHHRKSFAVRSLCAVVSLAVAISIYKPFFMTPHLVDDVLVSKPYFMINAVRTCRAEIKQTVAKMF